MNARFWALGVAILGLACGPPDDQSQREALQPADSGSAENSSAELESPQFLEAVGETTIVNPEFHLLDDSIPDGQLRKPLGYLKAREARSEGDSDRVRVEGIEGIIYREGADDLKFVGRTGLFDRATNHVILDGPITLSLEDITGELKDMEWEHATREVRSSNSSTFRGKGMVIQSESMTLQPSTGYLRLKNLTADFNFEETKDEN